MRNLSEFFMAQWKAGIFLLLAPLWGSSLFAMHLVQAGSQASDFVLKDLKGREWSLKKLRGSPVLVVFLRTNQDRSKRALLSVVRISQGIPKAKWYSLAIVGGSVEKKEAEKFAGNCNWGGPILIDQGMNVFGQYGVIVTPSVVLIDKSGKVAFSRAGYDFEFESLLAIYLRWCLGLLSESERDKALNQLRMGSVLRNRVSRLLGLAKVLRNRGKIGAAEKLARSALAEAPNSIEAKIELARILIEKKSFSEALKILKEERPGKLLSGPYHLVRGQALAGLGKLREAEKELRRAASLDPNSGMVHYELGKLYEKLGEKDRAIKELKTAFEKLKALSEK